ncbi:MAG: hypothetical protein Q9157_002671 [Trypethelium eluteriae]
MSLEHEAAVVPITAVAHWNGCYLVGTGNSLRLYSADFHALTKTRVFEDQVIHGIILSDASTTTEEEVILVIWGSRSVRFAWAKIGIEEPEIWLGPNLVAGDWILDARFDTLTADGLELDEATGVHRQTRVPLVTAHNALLELKCRWRMDQMQRHRAASSQTSLTELTAASRCILYSANLLWLSTSRILVAAGTAFGEIIVWSCNIRDTIAGPDIKVTTHNVFTGHEGSIYGLRISPYLVPIHERGTQRLLASCSDDRTIRVWQIATVDDSDNVTAPQEVIDKAKEKETGFYADAMRTPIEFSDDAGQLALALGHASRIWNVHFLPCKSSAGTEALLPGLTSVGEDATCQFWDLALDNDGRVVIRHIRSSEHHCGKNIWSSAIACELDGQVDVITGGADGSITLHRARDAKLDKDHSNDHEEWTIHDVSSAMKTHSACEVRPTSYDNETKEGSEITAIHEQEGSVPICSQGSDLDAQICSFPLESNDLFRDYTFIRPNSFVTMTKAGTLLLATPAVRDSWGTLANTATKTFMGWLRVIDFKDLRNGSTLSKPCTPYPPPCSFIGSRSGSIYHYDDNWGLTSKVAQVDGMVSGLFLDRMQFGTGDPGFTLNVLSLTVTTGGGEYLDNFLSKSYECSSLYLKSSHSKLKLPPNFVVTSIKHIILDMQHELLVVGSRSSGTAIYSICRPRTAGDPEALQPPIEGSGQCLPTHMLSNAHGKEAVTSIAWLPDPTSGAGPEEFYRSGYLFSTGRDGTYAIHHLIIKYDSISSLLMHKIILPFGPHIEGLLIDHQNSHLLLWGFRNKRFVLWNETIAEEVMSVECGGAHRNWAFNPSERGQGGMFVWTKANVCNIYHQRRPLHRKVRRGGHGREIKAVAVAPAPLDVDGKGRHFFATGAEDTDIRIFEYDPANSAVSSESVGFRCLRVLRKHNTGIQYLQWSEDGSYLFSSGGFEELFVWHVQSAPIVGIATVCESVLPFQSEIPDLRITSLDLRRNDIVQTTKTRSSDAVFDIACTYSDSTVRVYAYRSSKYGCTWQHVYTGSYGPNYTCLTRCVFLPSSTTLMTAGGDGFLAFWDLHRRPSSKTTLPYLDQADAQQIPQTCGLKSVVHQSTIKALAYHPLDEGTILLISGGDDNALGISIIRHSMAKGEISRKQPASEAPASSHGRTQVSLSTLLVPRAHSAAITAISMVAISHQKSVPEVSSKDIRKKFHAVTASNDQRIKTWKITIDLSMPGVAGVQVKKLRDESTDVADVASMAMLATLVDESNASTDASDMAPNASPRATSARVVVCGVGLEVWRLR